MVDPTISKNNTVQQNWNIAERQGGGTVSPEAADKIFRAAVASGGISMQELTDARNIMNGSAESPNLGAAQELYQKIAGANQQQGSLRTLWETAWDLRKG